MGKGQERKETLERENSEFYFIYIFFTIFQKYVSSFKIFKIIPQPL
jgi:hypothetical protein